MAQGRFALAYMTHDHLHGSHTGLPMVERVNFWQYFVIFTYSVARSVGGKRYAFGHRAVRDCSRFRHSNVTAAEKQGTGSKT